MKANQFMAGDWVLTDEGTPARVAQVNDCYYDGYTNDLMLENGDIYTNIQPIPLSKEILEKNGFVEQEYGWRKLNSANWCININIFNSKERYALSVFGRNAQVTLHGYYVHELQHALRLCEIDKTIEI